MAQYGLVGTKPRKTGIPKKVGGFTTTVATLPGFDSYATARAAMNAAPATTANPYDPYYKMVLGSLQSPAQIEAQARRTALFTERAQLAAAKAESDRIISQYQGQSARAQGFARALGELSANDDEQAFGRYTDAASRLGGLGAGLTGAVADAYQGDVTQANEAIARLTGGAGTVSGVPTADAIRNASNYMGVTVPAGSLQSSAVNAAALASADAASRRGNIAQIAKGYDTRTNEAIADAARDARTIIGGRGAAIQQAIDSLTGNRTNVLNALGNVVGAKAGWQQQQEENAAAKRKETADALQRIVENARADEQLGITKSYLDNTLTQTAANLTGIIPGTKTPTYAASQDKTQNAQTNQRLANEAERINHVKYDPNTLQPMRDKAGNLIPSTGYRLDKSGNVVEVPKAGAGGGGWGGMSGTAKQELITNANKLARALKEGAPAGQRLIQSRDKAGKIVGYEWIEDKNAPATPALNYEDTLAQLSLMSAAPAWKAQALRIAKGLFREGLERPWENPRKAARDLVKGAKARKLSSDQVLALAAQGNIPINLVRAALKTAGYPVVKGPSAADLLGLPSMP